MRFRNLLATALALAASASAPVLGATSAPAAAMTNAAAHVTIVHGVPSTPVDVYVNGNAILHEFKFASVTPALKLSPGTYALGTAYNQAWMVIAPGWSCWCFTTAPAEVTWSSVNGATTAAAAAASPAPTVRFFMLAPY